MAQGIRRYNGLVRSAHAWIGVVASLNLLVLLTTGVLIQHQQALGLQNMYISRRWLPATYRPQDGSEVRSDIVVTDLHSGRMLGDTGSLVMDGVTIAWFALLMTGLIMFALRNGRRPRSDS